MDQVEGAEDTIGRAAPAAGDDDAAAEDPALERQVTAPDLD